MAAQIDAWKAEGFEVTALERALARDPGSALKLLLQYSQAVERIRELRPAIEALPRRGQEERIQWALDALARPLQLAVYEDGILEMLRPPPAHPVKSATRPPAAAPSIEIARPRGMTNGLSSRPSTGRRPGAPQGQTNGGGRTNGSVPLGASASGGKTNGLVNGLRRARSGLTNGLNNPTGITNGLAAHRYVAETKQAKWKVYLIVVVSLGLLLAPLLGISETGISGSLVTVDGAVSEWGGLTASRVQHAVAASGPADIDLIETGLTLGRESLAGYVRVRGTLFSGDPGTEVHDTVRVFMDTDGDALTGYRVSGLGAEAMLSATGVGGALDSAILYAYGPEGDGLDWNPWHPAADVPAAVSGSILEFEFPLQVLDRKVPQQLAVRVEGHDSAFDEGDTNLAVSAPRLLVTQESLARLVVPPGGRDDYLRLVIEAKDGPVRVERLSVPLLGNADPAEITALPQLKDFALVATGSLSAGKAVFDLGVTVAPGTILAYTLSAGTGVATGDRTLGFGLSSPSDVTVDRAAVTLRTLPSVRTLAHITEVPLTPRIDGGFGEWIATATPGGDATTGGNLDVDLVATGSQISGTEAFAYAEVRGVLLQGHAVPVPPSRRIHSSNAPDSDRDTVPDLEDPLPRDFDNNGVTDTDDADGDGITDAPRGPDLWLETTIPSSFPAKYAGLPVRIFVGKITRPPTTGQDTLRVYWDVDGVPSQGYEVGGIFADYMMQVTGKNGVVREAALLRFPAGALPGNGSAWVRMGTLATSKDRSRIELGADLGVAVNASRTLTHFEIEDAFGGSDTATHTLTQGTRGLGLPDLDSLPVQTPLFSGDASFVYLHTADNNFRLDDQSNKRIAMRLSIKTTLTPDALHVYVPTQTGTAQTFRLALFSNSGGNPNAELCGATYSPSAAGWYSVTGLSGCGSQTAGTIVHIVTWCTTTCQASGPARYIEIRHTSPNNQVYPIDMTSDTNMNVLTSTNAGGAWTVQNTQPIFVLEGGGTKMGVTYYTASDKQVDDTNGQGVKFSISSNRAFTHAEFYLRRTSAQSTGTLNFYIRNITDSTTLYTDNTKTAASVGMSDAWVTWDFSSQSLVTGKVYYVGVYSSTAGTTFNMRDLTSTASAPYDALTFDGTTSFRVHENPLGTYGDRTYEDYAFKFTSVPEFDFLVLAAVFPVVVPLAVRRVRRSRRVPKSRSLTEDTVTQGH